MRTNLTIIVHNPTTVTTVRAVVNAPVRAVFEDFAENAHHLDSDDWDVLPINAEFDSPADFEAFMNVIPVEGGIRFIFCIGRGSWFVGRERFTPTADKGNNNENGPGV